MVTAQQHVCVETRETLYSCAAQHRFQPGVSLLQASHNGDDERWLAEQQEGVFRLGTRQPSNGSICLKVA